MSRLDWTVAQALGGGRIDGELYRYREAHEGTVRKARDALQQQCARVEALRCACEVLPERQPQAQIEVAGALAMAESSLIAKRDALLDAQQAQKTFRLRHGLTREPIAAQPLQAGMLLGILVFVEAGINAAFFQNAHMVAGPAAALLTSVLISLTNVTASTCAGYFIGRWKDYGANAADADVPEFRTRRILSRLLFWGFLGVMAFFHLSVGLVRALESLDRVYHAPETYGHLLMTPEAVFLVLTGACLSILAYHKGRTAFDDPYPGYGTRARAVAAAHDDLLDTFDGFSEEIEDRFDEAIDDAGELAGARKRAVAKYNRAVSACLSARRTLEKAVDAAESGLRAQVAQAVNHHRSAQGRDAPAPESVPDRLVSFRHFLDGEMPGFLPAADGRAQVAHLSEARVQALARLSAIFERTVGNPAGENS